MFLFCKQVKVYNYEYHYHYSQKNNDKQNQNKKHKCRTAPRINTLTTIPNFCQTQSSLSASMPKNKNKSQSSSHNTNPNSQTGQLTLLQKLRRKTESIQTSLFTTKNKKYESTNGQTTLWNKTSTNQYTTNNYTSNQTIGNTYTQGQNISFSIPKQIIISEQVHERISENQSEYNYIIEEQSSLVEQNITDKFITISQIKINHQFQFQQKLAIDTKIGAIFTLKYFYNQKTPKQLTIYKELQIYNTIGHHENIIQLYQVYCHKGRQVFVRQPYQSMNTPQKVSQLCYSKLAIARDIKSALQHLQKFQIYLAPLKICDICECFGVWKLGHFRLMQNCTIIPIQENIEQLINQIQ